jgi:hypothetical protein
MNRKAVLLDLALLALAAVLVWQIRLRWLEGQARERAIFTKAARKMAVSPPPPVAPLKQVTAGEYIDVAQKMLFARDRNPNVPIELPPPPAPQPPIPPMPAYYGQMTIGDPVVLLSSEGSDQKSYHVGDKVGPFEVAAFDREKIVLTWKGETVERKLTDLKPKEVEPPPAASRAAAGRTPAPAAASSSSSASSVKSIGASDSVSDANKGPLGTDVGGGFRACTPGDATPTGSVVNGFKKVVSPGMFGVTTCRWEQVK